MLTGSTLFLGTTGFLLRPSVWVPKTAYAEASDQEQPTQEWTMYNPELDRLIVELKKEKESLQLRESQLNQLAQRLEAERAEITIVTQAVQRMQMDFDKKVLRVQEQEVVNLKKLTKMYAAMDPAGAAVIFKQMEDDQISKILLMMKETESAAILENFGRLSDAEAKRAATISEQLRTAIGPKPAGKP